MKQPPAKADTPTTNTQLSTRKKDMLEMLEMLLQEANDDALAALQITAVLKKPDRNYSVELLIDVDDGVGDLTLGAMTRSVQHLSNHLNNLSLPGFKRDET